MAIDPDTRRGVIGTQLWYQLAALAGKIHMDWQCYTIYSVKI
jgi:hypothetical protein